MFLPSGRRVSRGEVESFLVSLPSPALLVPSTIRGEIALILLHELSGDRRRSEKAFSNLTSGHQSSCESLLSRHRSQAAVSPLLL